ncbi:Abelson tyrosine-protein kinase 2 [Collichthys lucidus]|uniref:Abelson tyrosine-protein kinase 2 n=1 Tax=Collichthys lucidus TaxID=240159 RepID=A0A4U5UIJ9_COLLU|nr:Abelson tyrosine-protein kinase 2 [Collichthys lucidus]
MGQQVGRVGEGTSTGLQPPQPHASQPHQGKGNRGSGAGRRPREPGSSTGTPPGRAAAANVPDPGINIFTQHSALSKDYQARPIPCVIAHQLTSQSENPDLGVLWHCCPQISCEKRQL